MLKSVTWREVYGDITCEVVKWWLGEEEKWNTYLVLSGATAERFWNRGSEFRCLGWHYEFTFYKQEIVDGKKRITVGDDYSHYYDRGVVYNENWLMDNIRAIKEQLC